MPYSSAERIVKPKLGIAFGSGVARGWAHIGIIKALTRAGFTPDIVSGTSIGALVGGCHVAGKLQPLEEFARSLTRRRMLGLLDIRVGGSGLISDNKLARVMRENLGDIQIEHLGRTFVSVATELATGHEVWLRHGSLIEAIRASYAMPGVFQPLQHDGRWLIDGALVNPVPVSVCRALGARVVIAVNLNMDMFGRSAAPSAQTVEAIDFAEQDKITTRLFRKKGKPEQALMRQWFGGGNNNGPGLTTVMIGAFNIIQDRLARSRLAADPPDVMIAPSVEHINPLDFDKADELIRIGEETAEQALPALKQAMEALG